MYKNNRYLSVFETHDTFFDAAHDQAQDGQVAVVFVHVYSPDS